MTVPYPIIQIPDDAYELFEPQGAKPKHWLQMNGKRYLFKIGRPNTGENWVEKVVCELCNLLHLPHAHYNLAVWQGQMGVMTENIVPSGGRLAMGNELLDKIDNTYPVYKRYKATHHTLPRIMTILNDEKMLLPINWIPPSNAIVNALDVFLGYLLLDAWIANQDRHHENWAVIQYKEKSYLAPTYDHAASLGHNLTDVERHRRLTVRDKGYIGCYIQKARSTIYASKTERKPLFTLDAFQQLAREKPQAAEAWQACLGAVSMAQCQELFEKIPQSEITPTGIKFALKMLELNQQRLLEATI